MKRAFTLIELLVVIAIIAILAAILFPVFAQAKVAAKKTASLSNMKQTLFGAMMYEQDVDDMMPLSESGSHGQLGNPDPTLRSNTWVYIVQPYMKSLALMVDPGVGDTNSEFGSGPNAWSYNQNRHAQYGYNYLFLSPFYNCDTSYARSATAAVKPAETVMFTTSQVFTANNKVGYYDANAPGAWPFVAPAPFACIWWDGTPGSGNWSAGQIPKVTASVRITPYNDGAIVAWLDGHAKFMKDGLLAAGTDYGTALRTNGSGGAVILNMVGNNVNTSYLWSLDGTINDLIF